MTEKPKGWYPERVSFRRQFTEDMVLKAMKKKPSKVWKIGQLVAALDRLTVAEKGKLMDSVRCTIAVMVNREKNPPARWGGYWISRIKKGHYLLCHDTGKAQRPIEEKTAKVSKTIICPFSSNTELFCPGCRLYNHKKTACVFILIYEELVNINAKT